MNPTNSGWGGGGRVAQLRVGLGAEEERVLVLRQLHVLHQGSVRGDSGDDQSRFFQDGPVGVGDLVAVAVPFGDFFRPSVQFPDERVLAEPGRVQAEPHRAAHVAFPGDHVGLVGHGGDDRVFRLVIELEAVGAAQPGHVAGVFDDHALQAQTDAEQGDAVFTGVADRPHFAFDAAHPETTGDEDPVDPVEFPLGAFRGGAVVAGHPADVDPGAVGEPSGPQRFSDRQVGVGEVDVFTD